MGLDCGLADSSSYLVIYSEHICDVDANVDDVHSILDWKLKLVVIGEEAEIGVDHPPQLLSADQLTVTSTARVLTLK